MEEITPSGEDLTEVKRSAEGQTNLQIKDSPNKSSKFLIYLFLFVLILGFGIVVGIIIAPYLRNASVSTNDPSLIETIKPDYTLAGEVALVEGVTQRKENDNWMPLNLGDKVNERDVIKTGEDGRLVVVLDDGSAIRLDKNTQVTLSTLSDGVILISQTYGRVYHRVQKGQLVYNVRSMDTLATALGTSFSVKTDNKKKNTEVAVYENKVQVTVSAENVVSEAAQSGEKIVVNGSKIVLSELSGEEKGDEFVVWNDSLNEKSVSPTQSVSPTPKPTSTPSAVSGGLQLFASAGNGVVTFSWKYSGEAPSGFKLMKSLTEYPTYPLREGDVYKRITDPTARSYTWAGLESGKTYHFRIGVYDGEGKITLYSNDVSATSLSSETGGYASSISLQAVSNEPGKVRLTWSISGGEATYGFKLSRSLNPNPEYPPREGDAWIYLDDENVRSYDWDGFTSGSTYHIRVGIYDGQGKVVRYSSDISVIVK